MADDLRENTNLHLAFKRLESEQTATHIRMDAFDRELAVINRDLAVLKDRQKRNDNQSDLLQAQVLRMEVDANRAREQANKAVEHILSRLDAAEQNQQKYQESSNDMFEGVLRGQHSITESVSQLAAIQEYQQEITSRAKSDRFFAELWTRISNAKAKIVALFGSVSGLGAFWHYRDSLTAWLKSVLNG